MNKIFLLFALLLSFQACTKETNKPENLLSKEKMVGIMADMTLAEAKIKNLRVSIDSSRQIYREYEKSIFIERDVSSEQYKESYRYYLLNYKEMASLHAAVIDTLNRRQQKVLQ